jgi:ribonuclease HII
MDCPNLKEEKKLWKKGFKVVVGLDEAGRGCLAGPVVAAAIVINPKNRAPNHKKSQIPSTKFQTLSFGHLKIGNWNLFGIWNLEFGNLRVKDSKKLTPKHREKLYKLITKSPFIEWGIGKVSEKVIDKINIFEATKLAMKRAIENLEKKYSHGRIRISRGQRPSERFSHADFLILDGNFKIDLPIPQKAIVKADEKVLSCALASILAKVRRDKLMEKYAKKIPEYGFEKHKGYPTKFHLKMLKKYGPCKIYRKSFGPVKRIVENF